MKHYKISLLLVLLLLSACGSSELKRVTLRSIDITSKEQKQNKVFIKPKSTVDIRKAYLDYLKFASKDDHSRLDAINRLAELEFELSSKLQKDNNED